MTRFAAWRGRTLSGDRTHGAIAVGLVMAVAGMQMPSPWPRAVTSMVVASG